MAFWVDVLSVITSKTIFRKALCLFRAATLSCHKVQSKCQRNAVKKPVVIQKEALAD